MSLDTVDDLHAAEDRIGQLESAIRRIIGRWEEGDLAEAVRNGASLLGEGYCRPTCHGVLAEYNLEVQPDRQLDSALDVEWRVIAADGSWAGVWRTFHDAANEMHDMNGWDVCDTTCGCPCGHPGGD